MIFPVANVYSNRLDCEIEKESIAGVSGAHGQAGVCASLGATSGPPLPKNRHPLFERAQGLVALVPESVVVCGICKVDVPGEVSRLQSLLAGAARRTLSQESLLDVRTQRSDQRHFSANVAHLAARNQLGHFE